MLLAISP